VEQAKPKIEPQEVYLVNRKKITFHCQTIPVILPTGLLMSEPNKTYSWYYPNSSLLMAKLNLKANLGGPSKIVTPGQGPIVIQQKQ